MTPETKNGKATVWEPLIAKEIDGSHPKLERVISRWDACLYTLCSMIGAGIFLSPKAVIAGTGSPGMAVLFWMVGGLVSTLNSFIYAELTLTFPEMGSDYVFIYHGLGDLPAFLYLWSYTLFESTSFRCVTSLTVALYICGQIWTDCEPAMSVQVIVAILTLSLLVYIHSLGTQEAVWVASILTWSKLLGLGIIIGAGGIWLAQGKGTPWNMWFQNSTTTADGYISAFFATHYAYSGIAPSVTIVEELQEPLHTNLLLAVGMSMLAVTSTYILANISYCLVLSPQEIADSPAVVMTFVAKTCPPLARVMPILVIFATLGTLNNGIFAIARLLMAGSRRGHGPMCFSLLNTLHNTPIFNLGLALTMTLPMLLFGGIYELLQFTSFFAVLAGTCSVGSLIVSRVQNPDLEKPFQLPLALPVGYFVISSSILLYSIYCRPFTFAIAVMLVMTGIPVYFLLVRNPDLPDWLVHWDGRLTVFFQKLLNSLPEHH